MSQRTEPGRVLSIQSHVVSGYVGSSLAMDTLTRGLMFIKATAPQLSLYSFLATTSTSSTPFNSQTIRVRGVLRRVSFRLCCTSGYGATNGHKTTSDEMSALFEGLTTNGLVSYSRILTGYIPGAEALRIVKEQIETMKSVTADLIYVLDRESLLSNLRR